MAETKRLFTGAEMLAAAERLADAVCADCGGDEFALVGIYVSGVPLAEMLCGIIERKTGHRPALAKLDISFYRDDIGQHNALPVINETVIPFDVNDMRLVLVDDVFATGRTIRAALDALTDYGRPGVIRLAVLVDRGGGEFPIRPDFTGMRCDSSPDRKIKVRFTPDGGADGVYEAEWHKQV